MSEEKKELVLKPDFIIKLQGKEYVKYAGVLDLAHQKGIKSLVISCIQFPNSDNGNEAICQAVLESNDGQIFTDFGDASPKNTNKMIAPHVIRMASTRAKARVLRDFTNVGMTAIEELGDINENEPDVKLPHAKPNVESTKKAWSDNFDKILDILKKNSKDGSREEMAELWKEFSEKKVTHLTFDEQEEILKKMVGRFGE